MFVLLIWRQSGKKTCFVLLIWRQSGKKTCFVMDVDEQIATDMVNEAPQEQYQRQNGRNTCFVLLIWRQSGKNTCFVLLTWLTKRCRSSTSGRMVETVFGFTNMAAER